MRRILGALLMSALLAVPLAYSGSSVRAAPSAAATVQCRATFNEPQNPSGGFYPIGWFGDPQSSSDGIVQALNNGGLAGKWTALFVPQSGEPLRYTWLFPTGYAATVQSIGTSNIIFLFLTQGGQLTLPYTSADGSCPAGSTNVS